MKTVQFRDRARQLGKVMEEYGKKFQADNSDNEILEHLDIFDTLFKSLKGRMTISIRKYKSRHEDDIIKTSKKPVKVK